MSFASSPLSPERLMARALELAERGRHSTHPNPRVGCVIVAGGEIVGEGWHAEAGGPHAEVHALRAAGERARGAEAYVTLEPCSHHGRTPPCVGALVAAGVRRVVCAMQDPNPRVSGSGIAQLRAAGVEVEVGLLATEAQALNRAFVARMLRGRPWVTLKLAASLDGRTAMASGESQWITGAAARADAHRLRAEAGAVLSSSATVLADDPRLDVRDFRPERLRQPDRIVLDANARVPATARVWAGGARRLWVTGRPGAALPGVERLTCPLDERGQLDLAVALALLAGHDVNAVLVECGPTLAGALLARRLVDELVLYQAPALLGSEARALAHVAGLVRLADRIRLRYVDVQPVGDDLRITAVPAE